MCLFVQRSCCCARGGSISTRRSLGHMMTVSALGISKQESKCRAEVSPDLKTRPFIHPRSSPRSLPDRKRGQVAEEPAPESPTPDDVSTVGATILSPSGSNSTRWRLVESPRNLVFGLRSASRLQSRQDSVGLDASSSQPSIPSTPPPRFSRLFSAGVLAAFGRGWYTRSKGEPSLPSEPPPTYSEGP